MEGSVLLFSIIYAKYSLILFLTSVFPVSRWCLVIGRGSLRWTNDHGCNALYGVYI